MNKRIRNAALAWLVTLTVCLASEPERAKGLSVHMLPDRIAQLANCNTGFTARDANGTESTYADAKQLVAFFQTLPAPIQENGIRSEEHTSNSSHGYISYAVFCL